MRWAALSLAALLLAPPAGGVEEPEAGEITDCARRNVPAPDSIRAVRIKSKDREGIETDIVLHMYGRRVDSGLRQLLLRFREPADVEGAALLILEGEAENDIYFVSTELGRPKRITGTGKASNLFGTDFSYEDLEHLEGFNQPGDSTRLEDETIADHAVYVIESRPEGSAYERVLSFVDKRTCVPLKMKFYENGGRLRKELTTNPEWIQQKGAVWIAHMALMEDFRDFTTTQMLVDSSEHDVGFPDELFTLEGIQGGAP